MHKTSYNNLEAVCLCIPNKNEWQAHEPVRNTSESLVHLSIKWNK